MLKTWESKHLGCNYVLLTDGSNRVLTSDGILLEYPVYQNLGISQYNELKKTKSRYDYIKTIQTGKLSLKVPKPYPLFDEDTTTTSTTSLKNEDTTKIEKASVKTTAGKNIVKTFPRNVWQNIKTDTKVTTEFSKNEKSSNNKESSNSEGNSNNEKILKNEIKADTPKINADTVKRNYINIAERIIMLLISCMTIILSIYYTRAYLLKTNGAFISTLLSVSMLLYSLIGLQLVTVFKKKKKYTRAFLFMSTSIMTILFSMFTSLDVNVTRYLDKVKIVREEESKTDSNVIILQSIKDQKEQNRKRYDILVKDMEYYAQRKLNTFTQREELKELDRKYEELAQKEIDIINSTSMPNTTSTTDKAKKNKSVNSLVDIIGNILSVDSNIIQMLVMCFASIFIDVLAPLALNIAIYGKEEIGAD